MSEKIELIIEAFKSLSLLDAVELNDRLEETFKVDCNSSASLTANPVISAAAPVTEEVEEKTEFNVMLDEVPSDKKIPVLKVVRMVTGLGLKEAKALVEAAPIQVQEGLSKEAAEEIKSSIETVGGKVSLT